MKRQRKFRPISWQLVDGIWHQVVQSAVYAPGVGVATPWRIDEELLPEPAVTLAGVTTLTRASGGIFGYMRYW